MTIFFQCSECTLVFPKCLEKTCGRCKVTTYCSKECQTKAWRKHQPSCTEFITEDYNTKINIQISKKMKASCNFSFPWWEKFLPYTTETAIVFQYTGSSEDPEDMHGMIKRAMTYYPDACIRDLAVISIPQEMAVEKNYMGRHCISKGNPVVVFSSMFKGENPSYYITSLLKLPEVCN